MKKVFLTSGPGLDLCRSPKKLSCSFFVCFFFFFVVVVVVVFFFCLHMLMFICVRMFKQLFTAYYSVDVGVYCYGPRKF